MEFIYFIFKNIKLELIEKFKGFEEQTISQIYNEIFKKFD